MCEAQASGEPLLSDVEFNEKGISDVAIELEPDHITGRQQRRWHFRRCFTTILKCAVLYFAGVLTTTIISSPWPSQASMNANADDGFLPSNSMIRYPLPPPMQKLTLFAVPIKDEVRFKGETLPPDYWDNQFLWGQPHSASNNAWHEDVIGGQNNQYTGWSCWLTFPF